MALEVLMSTGGIGPVDLIGSLRWGTLRITTTCDGSQGTCTFGLNSAGGIIGKNLKVKDGATTYFDGIIRQTSAVYTLDGKGVQGTVGCQDDATEDPATPAAPFDLSDTPNGTTTFGYRELTLASESAPTMPFSFGDVTGSVSTFRAGLAPSQLIRITKGITDYDVRIVRLTTTWTNATTPLFTAEFATPEGTILPTFVQTIAARTNRAPWWRYAPLATAIVVVDDTTTGDTGVVESAELTDLPVGCLGVQVRLIARTSVPDATTRVMAWDYTGDQASVVAYAGGVATFNHSSTGIVTTGGTNNRQVKYQAVEAGAGTLTYSVTVVGYFTNIASSL